MGWVMLLTDMKPCAAALMIQLQVSLKYTQSAANGRGPSREKMPTHHVPKVHRLAATVGEVGQVEVQQSVVVECHPSSRSVQEDFDGGQGQTEHPRRQLRDQLSKGHGRVINLGKGLHNMESPVVVARQESSTVVLYR